MDYYYILHNFLLGTIILLKTIINVITAWNIAQKIDILHVCNIKNDKDYWIKRNRYPKLHGLLVWLHDFNPKNIKVDKKLYKDILIYYIVYETLDRIKSLYIDFNEINGYIEHNDGSEYITFIPHHGKKDENKKYKETWNQVKYLTELENNDSSSYNDKCAKIRFTSNKILLNNNI